jgi:two-component system sporulation sensor kinase A
MSKVGVEDHKCDKLLEDYIKTQIDQGYSIVTDRSTAYFILDREQRFAYVSDACEQLVGLEFTQFSSRKLDDLFSNGLTHFNHVYIQPNVHHFDDEIRGWNGVCVDVNVTIIPIFHQEHCIGYYYVIKDISQIKRNRKLQQEQARFYEKLVEQSPDPVFILKNDQIINVNHVGAYLLGTVDKEEIIKSSIYQYIEQETIGVFQEKIALVESGEITDLFEQKLNRLDGEVIDAEVKAFPTVMKNEQVIHLIVRDISERKKLSHISEKQAAAGQLAAGIAHEIRNPITSIKGFIQLISDGKGDSQVYLDIINSEILRIEFILKELLVLAKPTKHKCENVNIRLLLEQVVTIMKSQAVLSNIEVTTNFEVCHTTVNCDENQLKQVFINYIKNAIEAMSGGGQLVIVVKEVDEMLQIKFIDEGSGIPHEILHRIGEPFFTTKENGTGLGMLVSQQIVKEYKGTVDIRSNSLGTCIEVRLPIVSEG